MKLSIFSKLLICFVITLSLLIGIVLSVSNSSSNSFVRNINQQVSSSLADSTYDLLLNHTRTTLNYLEEEIREDMYFADSDSIQEELSKFTNDPNIDAIIVFDVNTKILASKLKSELVDQEKLQFITRSDFNNTNEVIRRSDNNIIIARSIYIYEEPIGVVILSTNQTYYDGELNKLFDMINLLSKQYGEAHLTKLTVVIFVFSLFFIILMSAVISQITNPLRQLKSDIKEFGNDSQNTHTFNRQGNDEIAQLARSFYQMALKVRKREEQIFHLAETDTLTQLHNRASLINKVATLIDTQQYENLMCIYLDLDNFKDINDTFGHQEGDRLIIEVAKRLKKLTMNEYQNEVVSRCFTKNLFISRLGGDEFVLLFQFDQQTAYSDQLSEALAQYILCAFEDKLLGYNTSASFGISLYPQNGSTVADLLKTSDIAMYHAKSLGRNRYQFFSQEMSTALIRARDIEDALRIVLEKNQIKQLQMAYQPHYNLKEETFVGAEALIRWEHPKYGAISPAEFIPIAERRGLIVQFTLLTFDILLDDLLLLKNHDRYKDEFTISWNLSSIVLLKPNIAELLTKKLHEKGLNSKNISIEITETAFISDLELANKNIANLQKQGFTVWLDDFGTGYSSLSILSDVPIDGLKIDRSFVNKIKEADVTADVISQTENENNSRIIDAFIKLADTLKLVVVAEGIETQYQLDYLKHLDCTYGQGYYLGKPMPLEMLIKVKESGS